MRAFGASAFLAGWLSGVSSQHPCDGTGDRLWQPLPHCFSAAAGSDPLHMVQGSYSHIHMQASAGLITPPFITPGLFSCSLHPLPPCPVTLLSCQPALPSSDSLQQCPVPALCLESWLDAALCITTGLWPGRSPKKFNKFEVKRFHFI